MVDGDQILGICGFQLLADGRLPHKTIAVTVYSNLGLIEAFQAAGGRVVVTENGDRQVLSAMLERGLVLGGEQSGHIIFLEHNSTGDGSHLPPVDGGLSPGGPAGFRVEKENP